MEEVVEGYDCCKKSSSRYGSWNNRLRGMVSARRIRGLREWMCTRDTENTT